MPKVKNINGTSTATSPCKCGSWINHWKKHSKYNTTICSELNCTQTKNIVGAHVQKTNTDMSWYIIPLCDSHNKTKGELEISNGVCFISANKSETCDKEL